MPDPNEAEYGHLHLSLFYRRVVILGDQGLIFRNKFYPWRSIQNIEVWQESWPGFGYVPDAKLLPRARVNFANGTHFLLRGDALVKRGQSLRQGYSDAFNELVSYLREMHRLSLRNASQSDA